MKRMLLLLGLVGVVLIGGYFYMQNKADEASVVTEVAEDAEGSKGMFLEGPNGEVGFEVEPVVGATSASSGTSASGMGEKVYSDAELLALADNKYSSGLVPLGDYKYTTKGAKRGYMYLCNARKDNPGSMVNGPWMHGTSWNFLEKVSVSGSVSWSGATFKNSISGAYRILSGNGLPINHTTGVFPVQSGTLAAQYDPNPNTISAQVLKENIPANPIYHTTPNCMGGEVGVMLTGVKLFNGFDAGLRDAAAHELQDSCDGHPQGSGQYHYHSLSSCIKDANVNTVLGFAYDGFPITGSKVADGKYLTTEDLDECHGITSEIVIDGERRASYHYVMTQDFPYSASCFRGTSSFKPSGGGQAQAQSGSTSQPQSVQRGQPPQGAIDACTGKSVNTSCVVETPNGALYGICKTPPGQAALACVSN